MKRIGKGNAAMTPEASGIPVGNFKRYNSRTVIQTSIQPGRDVDTLLEDITTEGERQLHELVKKQINTDVTLDSEKAKRKHFKSGSVIKTLSEEIAGTRSHDAYKKVMDRQSMIENLMLYGLSEDEINFKLAHEGFDVDDKVMVKRKKIELRSKLTIEAIDEKICLAKEQLKRPDTFAGAKVLSRHEMDLEKAVSRNNEKTKMLGRLLTTSRTTHIEDSSDPINHLDSIYRDALAKTPGSLPAGSSQSSTIVAEKLATSNITTGNTDFTLSEPLEPMPEAGCAPKPRTVPIVDESDVIRYRLSVEEIKLIPKFKDYFPGDPTNIIYVKNLSPKVHEVDLKALFKKFDQGNGDIDYRLLTGRMKGQAFITFKSSEMATEALNFANGYPIFNKPLIIQYGKKKVDCKVNLNS